MAVTLAAEAAMEHEAEVEAEEEVAALQQVGFNIFLKFLISLVINNCWSLDVLNFCYV